MLIQEALLPVRLVIDPDGAALALGGAAPSAIDGRLEPWTNATGYEYGRGGVVGDRYIVQLYKFGSYVLTRHSDVVLGAPGPGVSHELFQNAFVRKILYWALVWNSWEVLHGCGFEVDGKSIALVGRSEMGKSTLARAWRGRDGFVFADDAVPLRVDGASVPLCPLPFRIQARPPGYRRDPTRIHVTKPYIELEPAPHLNDDRLRAVYVVDRRRDEPRGPISVQSIRPLEALPAVLRHAYSLTIDLPGRNRELMETYIALVNAIPVYRLSYPTGIEHVEPILDWLHDHVAKHVRGESEPSGDGLLLRSHQEATVG
jgi:hypothetical protein